MELLAVKPGILPKLRGVQGWNNCTGDRSFFCIAAQKDDAGNMGLFSYGDFIEIRDGKAYGITGEKSVCNGDTTGAQIKAKLYWWADKIAEWHEKTFDTTESAQRLKLNEEIVELAEAGQAGDEGKSYQEAADVFVVAASLSIRFCAPDATDLIERMIDKATPEFLAAVIAKQERNLERTRRGEWKKQKDGSYHH